jgi:hypothetical protein
MNLSIQPAIAGTGADVAIAIPRCYSVLLRSDTASFQVRESENAVDYITLPEDIPIALGPFLGQTIWIRAAAGVTVQVALM